MFVCEKFTCHKLNYFHIQFNLFLVLAVEYKNIKDFQYFISTHKVIICLNIILIQQNIINKI